MPENRGPTLRIRAWGPLAIFTRPELKVERVSYSCPTPSAIRGLLESILWKPAIQWHVESIGLQKPIRYISLPRNEVKNKAIQPRLDIIERGGAASCLFIEDVRTQRNTIALRNVDYIIEAHFTMTSKADHRDNVVKFVEMFERRVRNGQHFQQPYFGCRECVANVSLVDKPFQTINVDKDLGLMLWDIEYKKGRNRPRFFPARLERGVLKVPANPEAALKEWSLTQGGEQ